MSRKEISNNKSLHPWRKTNSLFFKKRKLLFCSYNLKEIVEKSPDLKDNIEKFIEEKKGNDITEFDYTSFAKNMREEAEPHIPENYAKSDKKFLLDIIENYISISAKALAEESRNEFSDEQIRFISQVVAEFVFMKGKDLIQNYDFNEEQETNILRQVAYITYEIAKKGTLENIVQDEIIEAAKTQSDEYYQKAINDTLNPPDPDDFSDFE